LLVCELAGSLSPVLLRSKLLDGLNPKHQLIDLHARILAMKCLTAAVEDARAGEGFRAGVWIGVIRHKSKLVSLPEPLRHALDRELQRLLTDIGLAGE